MMKMNVLDCSYKIVSRIDLDTLLGKFTYKSLKVLTNIFYPRLVKVKEVGIDRTSKNVISLTSFPKRIDTVWITITTLLRQTSKPAAVVLWLSEEEFPNGEKDLPNSLLALKKYGLTIRFCDNLYPHKKYFYALTEFSDSNIVTVDDDIFYPETLMKVLEETHRKQNKYVICTWAHKITFKKNGEIAPYDEWISGVNDTGPSYSLLPVGFGGVLYPPNSLSNNVLKKNQFMELCPKTDDLWLKCMSTINDTKVARVELKPVRFFSILKTQKYTLQQDNVINKKNDIAVRNIVAAYPGFKELLKR